MTQPKRKTRTMYMHTLDGKPASFQWLREQRGGEVVTVGYVYFAGGRNRVKLVGSLRRLRYEQRVAQRDAYDVTEWGDPSHYGYVLVEVPA